MTTTAVGDETRAAGLADDEYENVGDAQPDGHAPEEAHEQLDVEVNTAVADSRGQDVTFLSILAVTQLLWMTALGYGLFQLLK